MHRKTPGPLAASTDSGRVGASQRSSFLHASCVLTCRPPPGFQVQPRSKKWSVGTVYGKPAGQAHAKH